jgi:hypothetical protein
MDQLQERLTEAIRHIANMQDRFVRRDLDRMLKTVREALDDLDRESVECRRVHRTTARYEQLKTLADERMSNLEKHIVFARLVR